ncbi:unnamed protein product [Prorocentrum cordatum]|uniref:Mei2-like C-terminal RNA recognition motif domain-containing protein n=1 Tax=Prorocentrum cordatum TaxID=2364126 RepID=A0ABN9RVY3_9DINO|nr:unnamed protein product [Polarella glacialis]
MLRNLPRWLTQKGLVDEIHASGFEGRCDFCYVPQDFQSKVNHGHAFVNLTSPEAAAEFLREWQQKRHFSSAWRLQSPINISTARVQGLAANMSSPRMRRVRNSTFRPFVLEGRAAGLRIDARGP